MSKVSFTPIQPGDVASITAPNATMTATASATAAINAENVRQEGIDERNLTFPLVVSNTAHSGNYTDVLVTIKSWTKIPASGSWAPPTSGAVSPSSFSSGVPFTVTLGGTFSYAIIRYSLEVAIEGRASGAPSETHYVNDDVGFCIFRDGVQLGHTRRFVQNQLAKSASGFGTTEQSRTVQSVTIFQYVENVGGTFDLRYHINTHGSSGLKADTGGMPWVSGTNDAVNIRRLTASVMHYK